MNPSGFFSSKSADKKFLPSLTGEGGDGKIERPKGESDVQTVHFSARFLLSIERLTAAS